MMFWYFHTKYSSSHISLKNMVHTDIIRNQGDEGVKKNLLFNLRCPGICPKRDTDLIALNRWSWVFIILSGTCELVLIVRLSSPSEPLKKEDLQTELLTPDLFRYQLKKWGTRCWACWNFSSRLRREAARPPWLSPQTVARPRSSLKLRRPQPHLGLDRHHICQLLLLLHNQHLVSESEVELQDGRQSFELQSPGHPGSCCWCCTRSATPFAAICFISSTPTPPTSPPSVPITIQRTAPGHAPGKTGDADLLLPQPGWSNFTPTYNTIIYTTSILTTTPTSTTSINNRQYCGFERSFGTSAVQWWWLIVVNKYIPLHPLGGCNKYKKIYIHQVLDRLDWNICHLSSWDIMVAQAVFGLLFSYKWAKTNQNFLALISKGISKWKRLLWLSLSF